MLKKIQALYIQLSKALSSLPATALDPNQMLSASLKIHRDHMNRLKDIMQNQTFETQEEEIYFFKYLKPKIYAEKIFFFDLYNLRTNRPVGSKERVSAYFDDEVKQIERFLSKNSFMYQYYKSEAVEFDQQLFTSPRNPPSLLILELMDIEPGYANYFDFLFAKFIAYDRLKEYLAEMINLLESSAINPVTNATSIKKTKTSPLKTIFNLSVDQLGMGARAALDAAVVSGKSFQAICEELAPMVTTSNKDTVSPASLRSNAYTGEDIDKMTLIRYLEKMIRLIKEY